MQLRRATMEDMYDMQNCNLRCLPENYNLRLYYYHILSWPQLLYVQQDYNHKTVGYVLGKIDAEEDASKRHGHITSLAVLRSHRKLGIASRVMRATMREMDTEYKVPYCSLHVRKTNDAALHLYQNTLGYRCVGVEAGYYLDGEDAYHMKRNFHGESTGMYVSEDRQLIPKPVSSQSIKDSSGDGGSSKNKENKRGTIGSGAEGGSHGGGGVSGGANKPGGDGGAAVGAKHRGKGGGAAQTAKERANAMAEMLEELGVDGTKKSKDDSSNNNNNNNAKKSKKR